VSGAAGERNAWRYLYFCKHDPVSGYLEHAHICAVRQAVRAAGIFRAALLTMLSRDVNLLPTANVLPRRRHQSTAHVGHDAPSEFAGDSESAYRNERMVDRIYKIFH